MDKLIIDPCCGSRMMWYDKENPNVVFGDIRKEEHTLCDGRILTINPDYVWDAQKLPYPNNTFWHGVLDLPHLRKIGINAWMAKKYGRLTPTWETDVKGIFDECMRVIRPCGSLVFKWNTTQISDAKIIEVLGVNPEYGHRSGKGGKTIWMFFFKYPEI